MGKNLNPLIEYGDIMNGNYNEWNALLTNKVPAAMTLVTSTIIPTVENALFALVGNVRGYTRIRGDVQLGKDEKTSFITHIEVELAYIVTAFQVPDAEEEAIEHDEQFINSYLVKMENIRSYPCKINVQSGEVVVKSIIPLSA